jgi:outer membrane protein assembly factor BamB
LRTAAVLAVAVVLAWGGEASAAGWPTFGFDVQRSGFNSGEKALGAATAPALVERWVATVGGQINAQPLVAGSRVFVGTEEGRLVALDERTGAVVWQRFVGVTRPGPMYGCPAYPEQAFGITGTPTIARGVIYVAGGDAKVHAFTLATGGRVPGWPVAVARRRYEHVWGGLTLWRSMLYAVVASYCDQPPYAGGVVAVDVRKPRRAARWRVTGDGPRAPDGGGVWGWGGVSVEPRTGDVYAATGNALARHQDYGHAEEVVRLSRELRVKGSNDPFGQKELDDQDFGATPTLFRAPGCPPQLAALNKHGEMFIYRRHAIGRGPVQRLRIARPSDAGDLALLGQPAYDPARRTLYVVSPTDGPDSRFHRGLLAFHVNHACRLTLAWNTPAGVTALTSAPVVANGVVYFATGGTGEVRAVTARDGQPLATLRLGAPAFAAPTPVDGTLIAADYDGRVHLYAR